MQQQHWQPPDWWYRETKPPSDEAYFENMCRIIFQAGLNWHVIDTKWPHTKKAFKAFNLQKVASFTQDDIASLLKDSGVIRNKGKIKAIIQNAQNFLAIQKRYGSFQRYLDSLDKTDNYRAVVKDLVNKFRWLGPSSASFFLYTVGEDISPRGY